MEFFISNSNLLDSYSGEIKIIRNGLNRTHNKNVTKNDNDCLDNTEDAWIPREIDNKQVNEKKTYRGNSLSHKKSICINSKMQYIP